VSSRICLVFASVFATLLRAAVVEMTTARDFPQRAGAHRRCLALSALGRDEFEVRHHPHCIVLENVAVVHPLARTIVR
jgi:hypothetical protein